MLGLRDQSGEGERPVVRAPARAAETLRDDGDGRVLACAGCLARVTTEAAAIEVSGRHEHACENPAGLRFRVGCFAVAEGLVPYGAPSRYWSWFPGMSWQVVHCMTCARHLGWRFAGPDGGFYGLILDELVLRP